jgi:hypothetical protein
VVTGGRKPTKIGTRHQAAFFSPCVTCTRGLFSGALAHPNSQVPHRLRIPLARAPTLLERENAQIATLRLASMASTRDEPLIRLGLIVTTRPMRSPTRIGYVPCSARLRALR